MVTKERHNLKIHRHNQKFNSLSFHESNLSLIAPETMWLLGNHYLIPIAIQPKRISLEQICYKRSQGIALTSLHCLLFSDKSTEKEVFPDALQMERIMFNRHYKYLTNEELIFSKQFGFQTSLSTKRKFKFINHLEKIIIY